MKTFSLTHPHAVEAIRLAHAMPYVTRATITHQLQALGIPRALYVLACVLRAASAKGV